MLERQYIRDSTVATIVAAGTAAGPRVYPTSLIPLRRERPLPAIGVYTLEEAGEALDGGDSGPRIYRYRLTLRIDIVTETLTALTEPVPPAESDRDERYRIDAQDTLDALCEQVTEACLASPDWLQRAGIEAVETWSTSIEGGRPDDTDRRTMAASITALCRYTCEYVPVFRDEFCNLRLNVDVIDPACDPNTDHPQEPPEGYPGGCPGPDGRIEVHLNIPRAGIDPPLCEDEDPAPPVNGSERRAP